MGSVPDDTTGRSGGRTLPAAPAPRRPAPVPSGARRRVGRRGGRRNAIGGRQAPHLIPGTRSGADRSAAKIVRSEEHTSELQSLMRISSAVFCLKKKNNTSI